MPTPVEAETQKHIFLAYKRVHVRGKGELRRREIDPHAHHEIIGRFVDTEDAVKVKSGVFALDPMTIVGGASLQSRCHSLYVLGHSIHIGDQALEKVLELAYLCS